MDTPESPATDTPESPAMDTPASSDSAMWRTRGRLLIWWRKQPTWLRHIFYWGIALSTIFQVVSNRIAGSDYSFYFGATGIFFAFGLLVILLAGIGVYFVYLESGQVSAARTISRSLVFFTFILGTLAIFLFFAGVHIEACRTVHEVETCQGQASPRQILGMLAWHAANVVPALDITHTLEWSRPARSAHAVVAASILIVRFTVAIGILAVFKRLWDKWTNTPTRTPSQPRRSP